MSARLPDIELPLAPLAPALPARIGKYTVTGLIGSGAMGVVYRALDPHIQRTVAIKTIRPPLLVRGGAPGQGAAEGLQAVRRFRQEAQAAGRLNHPNIVAVYEFGETPEALYIAMECVEGRSLHAVTGAGTRLALADVMAVMLQLLDALLAAHAERVWHNDIKPSNLLITRDGRLKVGDFGIARVDAHELTAKGSVIGSPGYMSPERCRGEPSDHRADLFACGVLLYELLTGVPPFGGDAQTVMQQVLASTPVPPSRRPGSVGTAAFDAVVAKALARRPADRYPDAQTMRQALLEAAPADAVRFALSPQALVSMRRAPTGSQPLSRRSAAAPAAAPAGTGGGAPTWDAALLEQVETLLRPQLGAASGAVVRDASRRSASLSTLVARIANEALPKTGRAAFLAQATRLGGTVAASAAAPAARSLPVLGQTPMSPALVERAAKVLAAHIGPIALVHARRAAQAAVTREAFFCALAERAGADIDRRRLLAQLWKLG